ncbi:BTAD domain-containing putative transcriptional regulator [Phytomonospora endophytica]|uniref:DNA-binding SARP family transcriptional activator n=1 Tax=Phytomonospora endophytica TaxID=714109 RepID=A0A841FTU1_9ACTN|nr:BTAD domain-containing putative transcriptional regulator [Phytomonospora endophytica]MBB6036962.1 DNA-binding SARP family transcriptional activator [Phytomonospora endophytica]
MLPVRFAVLGPVTAENADGPIDLKGPRHRAVLARLLIARGRTVPATRLVADLWDDPPEGAIGAVQTFVAALRRALEPGRRPRSPARLLVTAAGGYALRAEPEMVDARRFERVVIDAATMLAAGRAAEVAERVDEALSWWRGPAYAEVADEPWALAEARRLDELRLLAIERRAEAALALGAAAEAVPGLDAHITAHPWREDAWRLLALALYRSGRQGDALDTLRRARSVLTGELGVDPGPGLRRLESRILAQDAELEPPIATPVPVAAHELPLLVGRDAELARLHIAADRAAAGKGPVPAYIAGDAGAGKTALAQRFSAELASRGWTTAWGPSPEHDGVPPAWAWTRILRRLERRCLPGAPELTGETPFAVIAALSDYLSEVSRRAPLLLVFDDLQFAGESTLELLAGVLGTPPAGPVLVLGTHRPTGLAPLTGLLARTARLEPVRVYLSGLTEPAVAELGATLAGRDLGASANTIHARSGGNPFYVKELVRLLDTDGESALSAVPPGVGEVVRHRLTALAPATVTVLRQAAVLGEDVDIDLITALAGDEVLDAVDEALEAGLLEAPTAARLRFAHALVRDTVYQDVSAPRRARWHATAAAALAESRPDDAERLAHHYLRADGRDAALKAAHHAAIAAERADRRFAPHEAARLWHDVLDAQDRAGVDDPRVRLDARMGLVRALAITGDLDGSRRQRSAAIGNAESLGDPLQTAEVITAFAVPALWTRNDDEALSARVVAAAERTLTALPAAGRDLRSRLLSTIALELRGTTGPRGDTAAQEAEELAETPEALAVALNARFMHSFGRAGLAPVRARIAERLVAIGDPAFAVLGHLIGIQAAAALADFATADAHSDAVTAIAVGQGLPLVGIFTDWYGATRLSLTADAGAAEAAYRRAAVRLATAGMPGMDDGLLPLALLGLRLRHGEAVEERDDWGQYGPWCRPLALLDAGRTGEARTAAAAIPPSPHDLLLEVRLCLEGRVARGLDDLPRMRRVYSALLPAAGELAGAGSGAVVFGPVASHLGDLALAMERPEEAAAHYERAAAVLAEAARR